LFLLARYTGRQLQAARALLGMNQIDLAKKARVAIGTIRRMESCDELEVHNSNAFTLDKVQRAVEKLGVEFLNAEGLIGVEHRFRPKNGRGSRA
jgi:transcriptional regulator with XRE-family HTH domain